MTLLLEIAQLPRATFYYHLKRMQKADKYAEVKAEISTIYHKNKGRYGYRRITVALHNNGIHLNHKTVQRLMKELDWFAVSESKNIVLTEEKWARLRPIC